MFTSRAEYRLLLRQDNADLRLMEKGHMLGLINDDQIREFRGKKEEVENELQRLRSTRVKPADANPVLIGLGGSPLNESVTLYQLLKRPEVRYADISGLSDVTALSEAVINQVEIQTKYTGYIKRQAEQAEKFKKIEEKKIPESFNYRSINGLSREIIEKLEEVKPLNLGQASRIPGITPAAISLLMVAVGRKMQ